MLEVILSESSVSMLMPMITQHSELSLYAMQLCLALMKYYSCSSYNSEEVSDEQRHANMLKL